MEIFERLANAATATAQSILTPTKQQQVLVINIKYYVNVLLTNNIVRFLINGTTHFPGRKITTIHMYTYTSEKNKHNYEI